MHRLCQMSRTRRARNSICRRAIFFNPLNISTLWSNRERSEEWSLTRLSFGGPSEPWYESGNSVRIQYGYIAFTIAGVRPAKFGGQSNNIDPRAWQQTYPVPPQSEPCLSSVLQKTPSGDRLADFPTRRVASERTSMLSNVIPATVKRPRSPALPLQGWWFKLNGNISLNNTAWYCHTETVET